MGRRARPEALWPVRLRASPELRACIETRARIAGYSIGDYLLRLAAKDARHDMPDPPLSLESLNRRIAALEAP